MAFRNLQKVIYFSGYGFADLQKLLKTFWQRFVDLQKYAKLSGYGFVDLQKLLKTFWQRFVNLQKYVKLSGHRSVGQLSQGMVAAFEDCDSVSYSFLRYSDGVQP